MDKIPIWILILNDSIRAKFMKRDTILLRGIDDFKRDQPNHILLKNKKIKIAIRNQCHIG